VSEKMNNQGISFRDTLLNQIKCYLDGEISKEEYASLAETFYTKYAKTYDNPSFHKYFLDTVATACLDYVDEPGLTPEIKEELFHKALSKAYLDLQEL
jgi:hypothetical protein